MAAKLTKLSDIDALIVRYADSLSPQQIAFKLEGALTPEQVMVRIGQLLDSPDWLSTAQQDQLVTLKMRQLVVELEEMPRTTRNAEVLLRGLEAIGARLEKRQAATSADLSRLYAFQAAAMVDAIEKALKMIQKSLDEGVDRETATMLALRAIQMDMNRLEANPIVVPVEVKAIEKKTA